MSAKVLRAMTFLGKDRAVNDIITDAELSTVTENTKRALVNDHALEIEGYGENRGSAHMDAATKELISQLGARFDAYREASDKRHAELVAMIASLGGKPAAKKRK